VSVTGPPDDGIPHGLKGARKPYYCDCQICKDAINEYNRSRRAIRKTQVRQDELAARRDRKIGKTRAAIRAKQSESKDSVSNRIGPMEKAIIAECENLPRAVERPTLVAAARNLAKVVDNPKMASIHTSTTKQLMAILADLHGDTAKAKATGKRKSGGRLATVGALTKVKRA
jgi:hypothetical protein